MLQALLMRVRAMPKGSLGLTAGLLSLGLTAYIFLLLAGHVLGDEEYAPLGVLWILVFLIGPAFLYPIEQELSRAIAARRVLGLGIRPVVERASIIAGGLVVTFVALTFAASPLIDEHLFNGQSMLLWALAASFVSYGVAYIGRGVFAGTGTLNNYGVLIAGEGLWRLLAAIVLLLIGVKVAGPYGLLVGICPLIAMAVAFIGFRHSLEDGPPAKWSELTVSLGNLVAAGLLSQVLVNLAPIVVKAQVDASQQALAGAFVKAVVITRIPLFLFQAIQAMMLPRLTHLATEGNYTAFRKTLFEICVAVGLLGGAGTLGAFVLGDVAMQLFGSDYPLPRIDITLLAAGNAVFLLAITVAQALVALEAQAKTVIGWGAGVLALVVVTIMSFDVLLRVELALIAGSFVSFLVMTWFVRQIVRKRAQQGYVIVASANSAASM